MCVCVCDGVVTGKSQNAKVVVERVKSSARSSKKVHASERK